MKAKILLQELWARGYDWDDVIHDEIASRIGSWYGQLGRLGDVQVPRCLREAREVVAKRIITFVDASLQAYGTVVYLQCVYNHATVSSRLVGVSMDVLWWIRGHGRNFRPFVANRIGEIQMVAEPSQWQHVPTGENPADLCTRGGTTDALLENSLWWHGPKWLLLEDKAGWPKMDVKSRPASLPELKTLDRKEEEEDVATVLTCRQQSPMNREENGRAKSKWENWRLEPTRFSSWTRLVRLQARVWRVIYNMCNPRERMKGQELLPEEIEDAEVEIINRAQLKAFHEKYIALLKGKEILNKSSLSNLCPWLDDQGVLRCGGRLQFSEYPPYNISGRSWIVAAREEIRAWENECSECKRRRNKPATQIMGPLPQVRLRFTFRAFDQTSVDYAGPFTTIQGHGRQRFTSRRGVPKEMISDNGTNFVGAVNELKGLVGQLEKDKIQRTTTQKGVKWTFNPPGTPHFGGAHEVMVKAAKKAIYAVLCSSDVTDEELITVVTGAESLLNSRPLTYQSANIKDDVPLTPNHFLNGQMGGQFAPESVDTTKFNPRKRWRKVKELISRVWCRWLMEYLPTLNTRAKWTEVVNDLKKGDIVLVLEKNLPGGKWPLGRMWKHIREKMDIYAS
ncbi:uncharacterized protein LOC111338676 [Stylophora pistillata]|uniref:uncharacterized protein LOC111338676 n=1 Tax=Stylophora pistillata TaxID=50429 RepID=UPI000C0508D3|nr:uncharacterized protein LOC111338676 [Stylophora pistillata]